MFGMALAAPGRHCEEPQGVREDARLSTATKQSRDRKAGALALDCFASLAMTATEHCSCRNRSE
jgi:hypothetical protein